jgi:hypothetical protein
MAAHQCAVTHWLHNTALEVLFNRVMYGSLENMAYHILYPSKHEQHVVIQILGAESLQPVEIHRWMQAMYGNVRVSKKND